VGTVTEIHDYLRLLFARAGTPYCPDHNLALQAQTVSQMVDAVLELPEDTRLMIVAPIARERKGEFEKVFEQMQALGYVRFRINGETFEVENLPTLKKTEKHDIDVVVDRLKIRHEAEAPARDANVRWRLKWTRAKSTCSTPNLLALFVITPLPNLSRACFRSTRPWALAPPAMAWAPPKCLTSTAWWPFLL
jgi:excinuclease UvrABC ATPase subunit